MLAPLRRRAGRVVLALALACAGGLYAAAPAAATPWGTSGADYDGILCHLSDPAASDVPMGSWTVNGTVPAFSTADVAGSLLGQGAAPTSGSPATMVPGDAGFDSGDIAAVAYLLNANQGASAATLAEISADVALVAGSGQRQQQCLGQQGTSARKAAALLSTARRLAGPYTVQVTPQRNVIPGDNASVEVTVRSAAGAGVGGLDVTVTGGGTVDTVTTGRDGAARAEIAVPAAAATTVTASVAVPTALTYLATNPPSVAAAPLTTVTGSASLTPVLHPKPTVDVSSDQLALAGGSLRPDVDIRGTYGYSGTGAITLLGPLQPADGAACSSLGDAELGRARTAWQQQVSFRGDARVTTGPTPDLAAGCYALRATVTTTNSSPPAQAASAAVPVTVTALQLSTKATAPAAGPGGLAAVVAATNPGRARVRTTVLARGPLPIKNGACSGNFGDAAVAGTSEGATLRAVGAVQQATVPVPEVRGVGCYALVARSEVTLDGRSTTTTSSTSDATMAIVKPALAVTTNTVSTTQGTPIGGSAMITGTFGFAGSVAVGLVQGQTVPITGCASTHFATGLKPTGTSKVATKGDATYAFRTLPTPRIACYAVVATFTLAGNPAVRADSGAPSAIFLSGKDPNSAGGAVVQRASSGSLTRAIVAYSVLGVLLLAGCVALFVRTFLADRRLIPAGSLWPWASGPAKPLPGK